jgi:hypothetical protein
MPMDITFESFEKELNRLVESFGERLGELKQSGYAEAQLRDNFLNPFFRSLGWDMENRAGLIQQEREVEIESATQIGGGRKRADYFFRTDKRARFVCEAKKPAEELSARYAFQAKRYAWNKGVPLAVLTDFEELKIYIVGGKPYIDEPHVGEWKSWHFRDYPLIARELWNLFARDQIAAGSIDQALDALPKKASGKGKARQQWLIRPDRTRALDNAFLEFLDETRRDLASDIYKNNDHADLAEDNKLTEFCQRIIDRILFLRICEDRDIDTGTTLQSIVETWRKNTGNDDTGRRGYQQPMELREEPPADYGGSGLRAPKDSLWRAVVRHFRALDRRPPTHVPFFNGNLFKPHDSEKLVIGDVWLAGFIGELSADESPYLFSEIPVEILGSVYERFLGNVVRPHGKGITVEPKPEVRKAGGVYYTPRYIVNYIVEQTCGKLLDEIAGNPVGRDSVEPISERSEASYASIKPSQGSTESRPTLKDFEKKTAALRLLDPACGSGSFLIRAFERVCEHWQKRLTADLRACVGDEVTSLKSKESSQGLLTSSPTVKEWRKKHRALCWLDETTGDVHLTVELKRQILTQNIYGVDLDSAAVEVTQLSLYLKMLEGENRTTLQRQRELLADETDIALLPPLQDNIKCGNSLIASDFSMMPEDLVRVHAFDWPVQFQSIMKAGGFDAVIGNPPYVMLDDGDEKTYMQEKYVSDEGKPDLYKYFVEKSHRLMNESGRFGMIMPASILKTPAYKLSRKFVLENSSPETVVVFNGPVFDEASVNCLILITEREPGGSLVSWVFDDSPKPSRESLTKANAVAQNCLLDAWRTAKDNNFSPPQTKAAGWIAKIRQNSVSLSSLGEYTLGMQVYHNSLHSQKEMEERIYHSETNRGKGWYRESGGSNIKRYEFIPEFNEWVKYGESWCYNCPASQFISGARILVREITGDTLVCAYTEETTIPNKAIIIFRSDETNLKFVLGVLNSKLIGKYVSETTEKGTQRLFPRISLTSLKFLPIPKIDLKNRADKSRHDKLVLLVDKMLGLMPKLRAATAEREKAALQNAVTATDQQIDALVYELYGLTEDEIKLVEGAQ